MGRRGGTSRHWKRSRFGVIPCLLILLIASAGWTAPTVTELYPPDGGTAPPETTVTATFSEPMDPATITLRSFTVSRFSGFSAVAAGSGHTVAAKSDGTVVAWGGTYAVPPGLSGVVAIAAGFGHVVALKNDGTVVSWGDGRAGQLNIPAGLTGVVAIAAGRYHSVAVRCDGTVVLWGETAGAFSPLSPYETADAGGDFAGPVQRHGR